MINVHPLEFVNHRSEAQLQVSENLIKELIIFQFLYEFHTFLIYYLYKSILLLVSNIQFVLHMVYSIVIYQRLQPVKLCYL